MAGSSDAVVVFDHVQLAFDDNVVLKDVSFTVPRGRTKIIMGASGSGKSTILKIIVGLLKADAGAVTVNGKQVNRLSEAELMEVRDDLGMIFVWPLMTVKLRSRRTTFSSNASFT